MQAMLTCTDSVLGNLTGSLKRQGQWNNTLLVWSSDNGGPAYWGANNHPLRGTKGSDFQGGVRTAAFVAGGLLPAAVRGTVLHEPIHVTDWYSTFCSLAGVSADDAAPGVPPVDAMDMWPLLTGAVRASPRTEVPLSSYSIIVGRYKLVNKSAFTDSWDKSCHARPTPAVCRLGFWTGPVWPVGSCGMGGSCPHPCTPATNCTLDPGCPNVRATPERRCGHFVPCLPP